MADERWQRTWELFHLALEVEPEARELWLAEACGEDAELRAEVGRLLGGHGNAPSFLDRPEELHAWVDSGDDLIGQTIGVFRLERLIGQGGMGVVYAARQEQPIQRTVALKLIQLGMATREVVARFESERQALAVLDHPNIAKVFDAGATEQGHPYFVMELVEGVAINRYCDEHRLSTRQRLELFIQVCRAIHHAHQKGIIHRDLKPSNVLVADDDGRPVPKVIDFGVARAVDRQPGEGTALTQLGRIVGTPDYMSPEQAEMSMDVDIRTDVYSLGVMLYELLVGTLPLNSEVGDKPARLKRIFRGPEPPTPSTRVSTLGATARTIADRRQTDPSSLRRQLRGDIDWIVMRALEKERDRRYGSASELAEELHRHLRDEPVLAGPPGVGYRVEKFVKRHRLGVAMAASAMILLLAFTIVSAWQSIQLRRALAKSDLEVRKSEEVTAFLTGLFQISDPGEARGNTIAAREILDRGAQRIATELGGQPEIQAAMMATIGEIYTHLGLLPKAEELLVGSLQLRREAFGDQHPDLADSYELLANLRWWQGEYAAAEEQARRALELRRDAFGASDRAVASSLTLLGTVLRLRGNYQEAEKVLNESMAVWRAGDAAEDPKAASTLNELGMTLQRLGRFETAAGVLLESLELGQRILPEGHPDVATRKLNVASVLTDLGRDEEAEALLRDSLETQRRVFGADHPKVAQGMNNLARNLELRGKRDEAETLYRDVLDMYRRLQVSDHADAATTMLNLGVILRQNREYEEAEGLYREALAIQQRVLGIEHPRVAIAHHNLASLLRRVDRLDEAEEQMRRAIEIQRVALGERHPSVARSEAALAKILMIAGRFEEAESILRQAEDVQASGLPEGHWLTWLTRVHHGECLTGLRRFEDAESRLTEALAGLNETRGSQDKNTRMALRALVGLYEAWNRPEDAARYRDQLLAGEPAAGS